ncbi:MAG: hypothetical protein RL014_2733 [Pseudomonadota bacterium]|jgi:dolichol-phosphate mannosyltransferase
MNSVTVADPRLVLVVPVYNEERLVAQALPHILHEARRQVIARTPAAHVRLLAIDDGSDDGTLLALKRLALANPGVAYASFTRNFGKEAAIYAGLRLALERFDADVVVVMDADLQHPPELIGEFWACWTDGHSVAEGVKRHRGNESVLRRVAAGLFYGAFSRASGMSLWQDTDFKLLDRRAAQAVLQMGERARFFRGMVRWLGFQGPRLEFDVPDRAGGTSGWGLRALVRYAWNSVTAFSSAPLRMVSVLGAVGLVLGLALGTKAVVDKLGGHAVDGFSTVILLLIIFSSLVLVSLGIIGSYIARIYDEIKQRPHYVLRPEGDTTPPGE